MRCPTFIRFPHLKNTNFEYTIPPLSAKDRTEEMDIEEWELLPEEGFLEIHGDDGGKKIHPKENTSVVRMDYFICPSNVVESIPHKNNQLPPLSVHLLKPRMLKNPPVQDSDSPPEEIITPPLISSDPVSQVFFKKMKETEFVDMIKVDSPRSGTSASRGSFIPQIEGAAVFQFDEKGCQDSIPCEMSEMEIKEDDRMDTKKGGSNIWKWSLTGIGAVCSLGVTVCCIVVFSGSCRMSNKHPITPANDKRIKQGVDQASRLSEAVRAMRGIPIAEARITFGGHYDAAI